MEKRIASTPRDDSQKEVLLFSTPRPFGESYLDSSLGPMKEFLGNIDELVFVPYAHFDHEGYTSAVRKKLSSLAIKLVSVHETTNPKAMIENASALFVGGGNTFNLLKLLYDNDVISTIQGQVESGMRYIGTSAGTVVAGPSIRTWEEMPIVLPPSLDALGLVPFEIRPHYLDVPPQYVVGNPPEKRIKAFHNVSDIAVVALHERARIRLSTGSYTIEGAGGVLFEKNKEPYKVEPGEILDIGSAV